MRRGWLYWFACFVLLTCSPSAPGQSKAAAKLKNGKEIFEAGCAGCHGSDGKGAPQDAIGFEKPATFPDFSKCDQTTPEDNLAWWSVIHAGGPGRSFSAIMPSFSEALTSRQIDQVVDYLRGFCKEKGWARGELNLPRALATEKAFPEDEVVITTSLNARGAPGVSNEIVHEQRFGVKNQIEVSVPVEFQRPERGRWYGGVGDVGLGLKRVLFSSRASGSIVSVQGGVHLPSGNAAHALGTGATTFETFAAYGQMLPGSGFVQVQGGAESSTDTDKTPHSVFLRAALGKSFHQEGGVGRMWSPMLEVTSDRDVMAGARTNVDVMPEMQVTLSRRQHVRFALGWREPVKNRRGRDPQVMFYLLWDWQDGKLLEGWR